ncbi:MAG: exodeoxyribonuclease V subunit alpha [Alcanivoracaceae bacterium]|nr:exodeoxyribonuclease V subunit alpha [Alcanivoracaceae bacterium]
MHPLLASLPAPVREALQPAFDAGVLRPLDLALAQLLARHSDSPCVTTLILSAWCSQQHGNGHVCLVLANACQDPASLAPEHSSDDAAILGWWRDQSASTLATALSKSALVDHSGDRDGNSPLVFDDGRLYLRRNWRDEVDVSDRLAERLSHTAQTPDALTQQLDALFAPTPGTDWQKAACALAARGYLTLITGGPGTGKTTTVVRLLALLQQSALDAGKGLRIRLAAPTGKAAARLTASIGTAIDALPVSGHVREAIPREVTTLHKLLGRRPDSRRFRHNSDNPLHADLVVVDEASMIDLDMMASLLRALTPTTRLVLIGDKDQLASVEAGAVMGDLCIDAAAGHYHADTVEWLQDATGMDLGEWRGEGSRLAQHTAMLRTSYRFRADSGIGALAGAVNAGDASASKAIWEQDHDDLARTGTSAAAIAALAVAGYRDYLETLQQQRPSGRDGVDDWAAAVLSQLTRFQLLCALRQGPAGVQALNDQVARALHEAGLLPRDEGWYEGRPVMVTRNDYQSGLMNGDVGVTLEVPQADGSLRLRVAFLLADGSLRLMLPSRLDQVETTFAMTVHKSQGSEFDHVALVLPDDSAPVVTRELLYTAITRARKRFTLASRTDASWLAALARPTRRASGLAQRLHGR